jgi:predicted DNA-binding transcriptional regulator YafY
VPLVPKGLGSGLIDRINKRVQRELVNRLVPEKYRDVLKEELNLKEETNKPKPHTPPQSDAERKFRIQEAGKRRVLLYAKYNGHWRFIEPYSFRYRAKNSREPLFYGWCYKDNGIEAFRLEKFEDLQVTERPFNPRFDVEF